MSGKITELKSGCIQAHPEYDACVISGFSSSTRYRISSKDAEQTMQCRMLGFEANSSPFRCRSNRAGTAIELFDTNMSSAVQVHSGLARAVKFDVNSPDIKVKDKLGYMFDIAANIGLSGGPVLDADGSCIAMCFMGLPADAHRKTQIGAIDIRQFSFLPDEYS
jgi:hypothetical protein